MPRSLHSLSILVASLALAGAAHAAVVVTFKDPEKYAETGVFRKEGPEAMKAIEEHLKRLGETHLPADQTVRIEILDIDLAGEQHMVRNAQDVRIVRGGADWPRIKLRYTWERPGAAAKGAEETVSDMSYLQRTVPSLEAFAYEKRMLETWFRQRFATSK